jgi:hypothetical protein
MNGVAQNSLVIRANYRKTTYRQQSGRYTPQRFGRQSWYRFLENRTAISNSEVHGEPTERQSRLIEHMINAEWQALKLEAEAETAKTGREQYGRLRLAADFRRQLLLLDRELARTTLSSAASRERGRRG